MSDSISHNIGVLNNLMMINNDRIEGYLKAASETRELDLRTVFQSMMDESLKNTNQLVREIKRLGGQPDKDRTSVGSKLFRVWMDIKSALTGKDRDFIINSCEHLEELSQKAYRDAAASTELSTEVRELVRNQQIALKASHDWMKNFRERNHYGYARTF